MKDKAKKTQLREREESETVSKVGDATTDDVESDRPKPEIKYYKTQPGDSILKVGFLFNMSVPALKRLNGIISDDLFVGQVLKVEIPPSSDFKLHSDIESLLANSEEEAKVSSYVKRALSTIDSAQQNDESFKGFKHSYTT